jgi:phage shock protein PspC (stress-responsive transcriptional regulator)
MTDIEARIAELFSELLKSRKIVEITDVQAAIRIMGTPAEFGDSSSTAYTGSGPWDIKTGKKLFRNTDDKVIGGVCSGLAAYFGIQEVLWVRLAFVIIFLTMGAGIVVYLVLWALVPEARTAADRLAMMGAPANAQNIARMVERGIEDLSTTIKTNWKQWNSKKKSRRDARNDASGATNDKPPFILVALLVPVVLAVKAATFLVYMLRRHVFTRNLHFKKNQFV